MSFQPVIDSAQYQKYLEYKRKLFLPGNNPQLKQAKKTTQDEGNNLFEFLVADLIGKLKKVDGLELNLKKALYSKDFKDRFFADMFNKSIDRLSNPSTTPLDFRFIKAWKRATAPEERLFLLNFETEINPFFYHHLSRSFIETYFDTCKEFNVTFNLEIIPAYFIL